MHMTPVELKLASSGDADNTKETHKLHSADRLYTMHAAWILCMVFVNIKLNLASWT